MLDFSTLALKNAERCEKGFNHKINDWTVNDWAVAVAGECGEMCNVAKKLKRVQDNLGVDNYTEEQLIEMIGNELADIVIYADLLATRLNMRLGNEVIKKFNAKSGEINSPIKL